MAEGSLIKLCVIRFTADGELDVMYEVDPTIVSF